MKIALVHGPNFRFLEKRDALLYGTFSLETVEKSLYSFSHKHGIPLKCTSFQSNCEGDLITFFEDIHHQCFEGIICNLGAYTHTSLALADCLAWISPVSVEVHISQVFSREEIRHKSMIASHCLASISGCGILGYVFALETLAVHCGYLNSGGI